MRGYLPCAATVSAVRRRGRCSRRSSIRPRMRSDLVPRPHLHALFDQAATRSLTLVSAPTGYGKTTLLSSWAHAAGATVAWLTLEPADSDPVRFLQYIVAALTRAGVSIGASTQRSAAAPGVDLAGAVIPRLLNDLAHARRRSSWSSMTTTPCPTHAVTQLLASLIERPAGDAPDRARDALRSAAAARALARGGAAARAPRGAAPLRRDGGRALPQRRAPARPRPIGRDGARGTDGGMAGRALPRRSQPPVVAKTAPPSSAASRAPAATSSTTWPRRCSARSTRSGAPSSCRHRCWSG